VVSKLSRMEHLRQIAACDERLLQSDAHIAWQRTLCERLEAACEDSALSRALLESYRRLQKSHLARRDTILLELRGGF
jgi:hypothetical protein